MEKSIPGFIVFLFFSFIFLLDGLQFETFGSLLEILDWDPNRRPKDKYCRATIPLRKTHDCFLSDDVSLQSEPNKTSTEKMMVCHDYGFGKKEDTYFQGVISDDAIFQIYDWDLIDYFVYFTHERLTVPPPGWINIAHKHGTKVLGVLLMEGTEDGLRDSLEVLNSYDSRTVLISRLVQIAQYFGFEGYLLNFEKDFENVEKLIGELKTFVRELTISINSSVPGSLIIWYDAITDSTEVSVCGDLNWQNNLTLANKPFFDISNGILLNYFWKEESIKADLEAACSPTPRSFDVFKGIDVFARGTPAYKEGMECLSAVDKIKKGNLSCGIYAPGYFYEKCPADETPLNYSTGFWQELRKIWKQKRVICEFPFITSFSRGHGKSLFINGIRVHDKPWFNLSLQEILPCIDYEFEYEGAFHGGTSLKIMRPCLNHSIGIFPLFDVHLEVDHTIEFFVSLTMVTEDFIGVYITVRHPEEEFKTALLVIDEASKADGSILDQVKHEVGRQLEVLYYPLEEVEEFRKELNIVCYPQEKFSWKRLVGKLKIPQAKEGSYIEEIGIIGASKTKEKSSFEALIGQLMIYPLSTETSIPLTELSVRNLMVDEMDLDSQSTAGYKVECQLHWHSPESFFSVFVEELSSEKPPRLTHLGISTSQAGYWVRDLVVDGSVSSLKFYVSTLNYKGEFSDLFNSASCQIDFRI